MLYFTTNNGVSLGVNMNIYWQETGVNSNQTVH